MEEPFHLSIDVLELRVAVRVRCVFPRLPTRLQTVPFGVQQSSHRAGTRGVVLTGQFLGQSPRTLARPTQGGFRIAARRRFHQRIQSRHQLRVAFRERAPTRPGTTSPRRFHLALVGGQFEFAHPRNDRDARHTRGLSHRTHSAPTHFARFAGRPLPAHAFIHFRSQQPKLPLNPCDDLCVLHAATMARSAQLTNTNLYK